MKKSKTVPSLTNVNFSSKEIFKNILEEEERDITVKSIFKYIIIFIIILLLLFFINRILKK
jgi:hypothetical protein